MSLLGKYDPRRGGHAPGHLRDAFYAWIEDGAEAETVTVGYDDVEKPAAWLLGALWNCTDVVPGDVRQKVEGIVDARVGSVASAVRHLKRG
ncbi:MAG: hypothetical protein HY615_01905 [Candidatus Rokubacteria bacterium]|nr:hypothetical protein [Candidatus Rokubacteria bacterium]